MKRLLLLRDKFYRWLFPVNLEELADHAAAEKRRRDNLDALKKLSAYTKKNPPTGKMHPGYGNCSSTPSSGKSDNSNYESSCSFTNPNNPNNPFM